ncbi:MAG: hypothetical protein AB7Q17_16385, partial [Phycisphaerae bacterium]
SRAAPALRNGVNMTTHTRTVAVVILLLSMSGAAGQTTYSRIAIGDRWYIRCLRESNDLPPGAESGGHFAERPPGAALTYRHWDSIGQPRYLYFSQFGAWGGLLREELIDSSQPPGGAIPLCVTNSSHTWLLWLQDSDTALAQVRDALGDPIGPSFPVSEGISFEASGRDFALEVSPTTAWIGQQVRPPGPVQLDILLRKYTVEGQLEGAVTIDSGQGEAYTRLTEAPNGSLYMAYLRGNFGSGVIEAVLHRVDADLTVSESVVVDVPSIVGGRIYARALADNTILVAWGRSPAGSAAFVRRYNLDLTPAGPAIAIDPDWRWAHADAAGNLIVGRDPGQAWIRLYDAAGNALSDRITVLGPPEYPLSSFNDASRPFILKDDGTIYALFVAMGNFDLPDDSYISVFRPYEPGDCNYDGRINNFDIDAFVLALSDGPAYEARYHIPAEVGRILGDVNEDGALNNFDIDPFVELLVSQP